jgi:hypothetical protein
MWPGFWTTPPCEFAARPCTVCVGHSTLFLCYCCRRARNDHTGPPAEPRALTMCARHCCLLLVCASSCLPPQHHSPTPPHSNFLKSAPWNVARSQRLQQEFDEQLVPILFKRLQEMGIE